MQYSPIMITTIASTLAQTTATINQMLSLLCPPQPVFGACVGVWDDGGTDGGFDGCCGGGFTVGPIESGEHSGD